jgi:hypothetical protein
MNYKPVCWNGRFMASYKLSFSNKAYDRQVQRGRLSGNGDSYRINKSWIPTRLSAFLNLHGLDISSATARQHCVTPLSVPWGCFNYLDVILLEHIYKYEYLHLCPSNWIINVYIQYMHKDPIQKYTSPQI